MSASDPMVPGDRSRKDETMTSAAADMMTQRRSALDGMADLPESLVAAQPLADMRIDVGEYFSAGGGTEIPDRLVLAVSDVLLRDGDHVGAGAAVVSGLSQRFDIEGARAFHEVLFRRVWEDVRARSSRTGSAVHYRIKTNVTADGAIPLELYGSNWSFKQLHMDRDALLFSHLYGPVAGFTGGSLLLVDVRTYLQRHSLRFKEVFEWSDEPTAGSKPVLRLDHQDAAVAECGIDLGVIGPDEILFVNNFPEAGILHGVAPVVVADRTTYVREFHRCSVKDVRLC